MSVNIPISIGELWDKYTILRIKQKKIHNEIKLSHINLEITYLQQYMNNYSYIDNYLFIDLENTNCFLWDIEDKLRIKEQLKIFDNEFIELARSVYYTNDKRSEIKNQINVLFNSIIYDIKEYINYNV